MWIADTVEKLRDYRALQNDTVALVPTMGALHDGHLALVRRARELADATIVSIFVNPTQFARSEDYEQYPRHMEKDLAVCRDEQVDGVFSPTAEQMYPSGQVEAAVSMPPVADDLEGRYRPGHFEGVCRVVARLFNLVQPDIAVFGLKDYQQLLVIDAMAANLASPVRIEAAATVREPDGLALSSRNSFLDATTRKHALGLVKALREAKMLIEQADETDPAAVEHAMHQTLTAHQVQVDYAVVRHRLTLTKLDSIDLSLSGGVVALAAGRIGDVRLIDNMIIAQNDAC